MKSVHTSFHVEWRAGYFHHTRASTLSEAQTAAVKNRLRWSRGEVPLLNWIDFGYWSFGLFIFHEMHSCKTKTMDNYELFKASWTENFLETMSNSMLAIAETLAFFYSHAANIPNQ